MILNSNPTQLILIKHTVVNLVWYFYWKAGKELKIFESSFNGTIWKRPGIIKPYDFKNSFNLDYNGLK